MRMLVLGGTLFLSHAVVAEALARGHDVTCAARGKSGSVPEGAALVPLDRTAPDWGAPERAALTAQRWDAVVDVARRPSWVRDAVDALAEHTSSWVFVSTCSVYADHSTPGQKAGTATLLPAAGPDVDETDMANYGELKAACEEIVQRRFEGSELVVRPGLIVGPGDPSGRFTYWPARMASPGRVLAPGSPNDSVQVVDVRDLARWLVDAAERGLSGAYDLVGPVTTRAEVLERVSRGVGADPELVWVDQEFLLEQGVEPWMGERSVPLWLPVPEYAGLMSHDVSPALETGLAVRPLEDTARDTLDWLRATPGAAVTGISTDEERELLRAWERSLQEEGELR